MVTQNLDPYEKLIAYVKSNPVKGSLISHSQIEKIIGIPYKKNCKCLNSSYSYQIAKANKKLTEVSLRLESMPGYGYRIIQDNQYCGSMMKAYHTSFSFVKKAKFIGDHTKVNNLTLKEKEEFNKNYKNVTQTYNYLLSLKLKSEKGE